VARAKKSNNTIVFIQPFVPSYRVGLFDAIAARLKREGLELEVWHAEPKGIVAARRNSARGPWSVPITQHRATFGRRNVTYRAVHRKARRARAVITGLASSSLETYLLAADPQVNLMLWGHGRNYTAGNNSIDAKLEGWLCARASQVFTYTAQGAVHVAASGVPAGKISTVVNTTDTARLRRSKSGADSNALSAMRRRLGIGSGPVALFVGAFDVPKRLPFLFEACDIVRRTLPNFELVLAGAGPLDAYVREESGRRDYLRLAGRLELDELAVASNFVDAILIPGRVGLVAVDSLALGVPIFTTKYPFHAPEADYLTSENSVWTDDDPASYAASIVQVLGDPQRLAQLHEAAAADGDEYSAEKSADNFVNGILRGLGLQSAATATSVQASALQEASEAPSE
jgi:glycosyltransferase involved in cell wall biosynthesis